jgi:DNA polymerase-3 subunit alpha
MEETKKQTTNALIASDFVHLHNHTHHSLLDGLTKVPSLIEKTKDLGMRAVAITDHGTMSGVIEFYKAARSSKIKPIIGMEAYVAARSHKDRDPQKDKARYHLIILAMNNQGYQNLMKLSTVANLDGFYYKPRIDHELLMKYNEGLVVLSGCASSEIGESLRIGNISEAKKVAKWYKSIFGERYYLELQDHGHPKSPSAWDVQVGINKHLLEISDELDIPCVVTSDGHYLNHDDQDAHEVLLCVGTGAYLSDSNRMSLKDFELHVTDPKEIIERWGDTHPEAIKNTKKIADQCNVEIELGRILIPKFPTPENQSEKEFLHMLTYRGMATRYLHVDEAKAENMPVDEIRGMLSTEQRDRLDMELGVMDKMGYNGYFLIVQDFINWGKQRGIIFGPGRGSAAGSIVAFALNITDLDPLQYNLLFERFLNPDRISMPDIDIDIQDTRRDEVIQYCADKYGNTRVANIVTFGTMAARASVRDVARVLQVPYAEADRLSKMIPPPIQGRHIPLSTSIKDNVDLREEYKNNVTAKEIFDYAMRLEGTIRSHGVHAAGVVIAPDDIVNYSPLEMAQKGVVSTQYSMGPVEELGLLKMDFLGLSNLTIINNTLRIIRKVYGKDIELSKLPLDDDKTYQLFQKGDTTGVFQLESAGMKRYLKELKPTVFDDIIAMVALYRPGPMQFIESFIKRKHGKEKIEYLHEGMKSSLENTYGILVYQEQFMQISKEWCGFTGGQADTLRKAVGKKKIDLMRKVRTEFVEGAMTHGGASKEIAEKFWAQLEEFANYCFNKSHAACYALIAYWTAYLKAQYPDAFMAALMTSDQDDIDRLAIEIAEAQHMGMKVLPPDVNESFVEFAVVPGRKEIRFGLAAVKGVGVAAVEEILRAREEGKFNSIEDFAKRVSTQKFNKKAWESLIKSGGFDSLGDRSDLLHNLESIQGFASKLQKEAASGQTDLFGLLGDSSSQVQPSINLQAAPVRYSEKERLMWERELMGLYISAHPLDEYAQYFAEQTVPLGSLKREDDNHRAIVGGLISTLRTIITKNGSKMAFIGLEDKTGIIEVIVFPKLFTQIGEQLKQDVAIRVEGTVNASNRDGTPMSDVKFIADNIMIVTDQELRDYQPTGGGPLKTMSDGTTSSRQRKYSKQQANSSAAVTLYAQTTTPIEPAVAAVAKQIFVHVKNADDHDVLMKIKKICRTHPGFDSIVLVLGEDKKSAIKLPFPIECNDQIVGQLVKLLGEDSVVVKEV